MRAGISYFNAARASSTIYQGDVNTLSAYKITHYRVWASWDKNGSSSRVVKTDGTLDATRTTTLKNFIAYVKSKGGTVDVTLGSGNTTNGFPSFSAHKTGVTNLVTTLRGVAGIWNIDVANEYPVHYTDAQAAELLQAARAADGSRGGFTASIDGDANSRIVPHYKGLISALGSNRKNYLGLVAPHFGPRTSSLARNTLTNVKNVNSGLSTYKPQVYLQEEGRWNNPNTSAQEYYDSFQGARNGGAVLWILHTAAGYDLTSKSLISQLNSTEKTVLTYLGYNATP